MAITITISDQSVTQTFPLFAVPLNSSPKHIGTDVETADGNVSTYYKATKQNLTVKLGFLTAGEFSVIKGFIDRQYENRKYPVISIDGAPNLSIHNMTAKMTISDQNITDNYGNVDGLTISFRESKQI